MYRIKFLFATTLQLGEVEFFKWLAYTLGGISSQCLAIIFTSVDTYGVDFGLNQFYYTMKKAGFIVNLYQMEGGSQKQVDVAIGSHLVYYALKGYDIILSSGYIGFVLALQMARKDDDKINVTLLTFNFGVHEELSKLSTDHLFFEDYPKIIKN